MRKLLSLAFLFVCATASAQVTLVGSVGAAQVVPDPMGGSAGNAVLTGKFCGPTSATPGLTFTLSGLPLGYNGLLPNEEVIRFRFGTGFAALPGITSFGGQLLQTPGTFRALGGLTSGYLGPAGILCPGYIPLFGPTAPLTSNGARVRIPVIPPSFVGNFSMQAVMVDRNITRIFTSNALNFTIP